jgi:Flp pilus assembly pilin Flp
MPSHAKPFVADTRGGSATEYGMIAGIIAVGIAGAFTTLSSRLMNAMNALNF